MNIFISSLNKQRDHKSQAQGTTNAAEYPSEESRSDEGHLQSWRKNGYLEPQLNCSLTIREKRLSSDPYLFIYLFIGLFLISASLLNNWWTNIWSASDFKSLVWSEHPHISVKSEINQSTNKTPNKTPTTTNHYCFALVESSWEGGGLLFVSIFQNCLLFTHVILSAIQFGHFLMLMLLWISFCNFSFHMHRISLEYVPRRRTAGSKVMHIFNW